MKYFVFAVDDGTIYDRNVIDIFNKYNIKATFNLNSGLQDYVWHLGDLAISRLNLNENKHIYDNHEVASHSLTHTYLTSHPDEVVYREVKDDIDNLEKIFKRNITSFSFPFEHFDERTINIVKSAGISHIILPEIDTSFKYPKDTYHIKVTSYDIDDALDKFYRFIEDNNAELFLYLSHSYDYEVNHNYDKLEKLCKLVTNQKDIRVITVKEI